MLDLFSGIGGFSLAAEWVWGDELEIVGFCENEPYPQKVLKKNFPGVPIYKDIKELDGEAFKDIDLITGGFPCQDISVAGKGAGIEGARSGLWSEMHRLISHIRPRYVIIENVPMLTVRGGTRVISDLAEAGMSAEWQTIGADDVGAWHRRKRIWIVAYPDQSGLEGRQEGLRQEKRWDGNTGHSWAKVGGNGRDGFWLTEPDLGRVANGIPSRVDRLKGLGNAIVPQCAIVIMELIKQADAKPQ